ncbi:MAG: hypothetical protein CM15mP128_3760 [Methanobacteriota archaeon]|nr:MAG: hypothetical protein CM15mP128_3760 [Euryarchaeota archaeon]
MNVKEVRERAQTGGTLSLADLGALLDQRGLPDAQQDAKQSKRHRHKSERHAASRRRNDIQQRRGKRGKGPRSPGSERMFTWCTARSPAEWNEGWAKAACTLFLAQTGESYTPRS